MSSEFGLKDTLDYTAEVTPVEMVERVIFGKPVRLLHPKNDFEAARQLIDLREIYEPFLASRAIPKMGLCLDIGAGAGYFGLPFAIAFPDWTVVCVEADHTHFVTLTKNVDHLGLRNVVCINAAFHPDIEDNEAIERDQILRGEVRMPLAHFQRLLAIPTKFAPVAAANSADEDIVMLPSLPLSIATKLSPDMVRLDAPGCEAALAKALLNTPTGFIVGRVYPYVPSCTFTPAEGAGKREFYLVHGEHALRRDYEDNFATRRPGLDIIVAMFNSRGFIQECVDSLLSDGNSDIRVVVVDDGSTDGSGDLVEALYNGNVRVQLLRKANGGCASARNFGRRYSNMSHISFVDADDRVDPGMFSALLEAARYTGAFVAEAEFKTFTTDPDGFDKFSPSYEAGIYVRPGHHGLGEFDYDWIPGRHIITRQPSIWRRVHRRDFLDRKNIWFPEHVRSFDDQIFQLYVGSYAGHIVHVRDEFYHYRQHQAQDTQRGDERHFYSFNMFRAVFLRALDEGWADVTPIVESLINTLSWSYAGLREDLKPIYVQAAVEFLAILDKSFGKVYSTEGLRSSGLPGLDYLVMRRVQEMSAIPTNYAMMRLESWRWQPEFIQMMASIKVQ